MGRRTQGSIVRKKSLWYGVADLGRDARGVRCRKWTRGFEKRRDAERDLARLISTATPTLPAQMTVAALVQDYVDHVESQGRQRTTVARYQSLLRSNIEPSLATTRISSIRGSLLNDFYAKLRAQGLSDTTIVHVHGLLTATFRWGRRCGRTDRDPMIGVDPPRRSRSSARAMRPEDARAFFAWLPTTAWARWHPLFLFALATGMRRGELLALRRENVDVARGVVIVAESLAETKGAVYRKATKSEHIREIPLSALAVEALELAERVRNLDRDQAVEAYEDHDLVFPAPSGQRIRPMTVTDAIRRAADTFGKPDCTLHTLRHTAATWLLTSGADLRTTSSILGHADATTTLRVYSHVVSERQRSAVALKSSPKSAVNSDS